MTDPLENLEKELKGLNPQPVSAELRRRIAEELEHPGRKVLLSPLALPWNWLAVAAAAVVLVMVGLASRRLWPQQDEIVAEPVLADAAVAEKPRRTVVVERVIHGPVAVETLLVSQHDEGPVIMADRTPARRMRYRYVDQMRWQHPERGVNYSVSAPRDEIVLVSMETN